MKKFAAFILVLILAAGGYMFATGQLQISFPADRTNSPISHAAAESKSQPDESALDGMKRIDTQIWNAIKNGDESISVPILTASGWDETDCREYVRNNKADANALSKRVVHTIVEMDGLCLGEAIHYLVTGTKKDWDESNSSYQIRMRKVNGKWEPTVFSEEECEMLNEEYYKLYNEEAIDAALAGRNMSTFGNMLWIEPDGVEEGAYLAETAYMYQKKNGDVVIVVKLANGQDTIRHVKSISVTIKDDKLGQILKVKEKCSVSLLPGTVELYEITVKAGKVKKGTWGSMHSDVQTTY